MSLAMEIHPKRRLWVHNGPAGCHQTRRQIQAKTPVRMDSGSYGASLLLSPSVALSLVYREARKSLVRMGPLIGGERTRTADFYVAKGSWPVQRVPLRCVLAGQVGRAVHGVIPRPPPFARFDGQSGAQITGRRAVPARDQDGGLAGCLSARCQRREVKVPSGVGHPVVVRDHADEVLACRGRGRQVDGVKGADAEPLEAASREEEIAVDDQLLERVQMRKCHLDVAVDATDGSKDLGDGELASHKDILGAEVVSPGRDVGALALGDGELHDCRRVQVPDVHRSSARSSASASDAGRRVFTGAGSGPVTVADFSLPA